MSRLLWRLRLPMISVCCLLPLVTGCGAVDDRAERYPVSGKVTQGGSPVSGAAITFVPKESGGTPAFATTDEAGVFKLTTFDAGDGAIPGDYHVKVEKYESTGPEPAGSSTEGMSELDTENYEPDDDSSTEPKNLLPSKYADPYNSGLLFRVIEEENTFDIELE